MGRGRWAQVEGTDWGGGGGGGRYEVGGGRGGCPPWIHHCNTQYFFSNTDAADDVDVDVDVPRTGEEARRYVNRSLRRRNRKVTDLASALDETNYVHIQPSNADTHTR